jgi:D-alanyl-D-alanine carboxypeptidase
MSTRLRTSLAICLLLAHPACKRATVQEGDSRFSPAQLKALIGEHLAESPNILGTIVKVDIQGGESYEAAGGFIDSAKTVPMQPDTRFIVGSVTKIFTAVLVHQLMEDGLVEPRAPIIGYLPPDWSAVLEEIEHGQEITVEQVLSHRSGIADVTNSEEFWSSCYLDPTQAWKPLDVLKMVRQQGKALFSPGDDYDYSNVNYILLGKVIEFVSGLSYRQSLQKNILQRIGLENTFLIERTYGSFDGVLAHGYARIEDTLYAGAEIHVEWAAATGGIVSTAGDLITFYRALATGDLFDDPGTYRQMLQRVGHNESYGRGLEILGGPDIGLAYGHRGNFMGTRSLLAHFPEDRMTLVLCHTYQGFSMSHPSELMERVVRSVRGDAPALVADPVLEAPEILADTSHRIVNQDTPAYGEWDFAPREEWSLNELAHHPLRRGSVVHVDADGSLYLLDRVSARVAVLGSDGQLLRSFGGHGDGPRFAYPLDLFLTSRYIHVLDMARSGDKIKTYDKSGNHVATFDVEKEASPRLFVDDDTYVAVRSGPDVLNRPPHERLEIVSRSGAAGAVLGKFPAEDKLIMEVFVPMGRYILLENDINIFPRLIVHFDGAMLYLGRSDAYTIKRVDLNGGEDLAFSIAGRVRELLPRDYAVNLAGRKKVAGTKEMTGETKEQFVERFPERQVFYTKIATDEQGLVYVFGPDVTDFGTQEIDIFSPEGEYLYRAALELPGGRERISPLELDGEQVYALVRDEEGAAHLVKYEIDRPVYPRHP